MEAEGLGQRPAVGVTTFKKRNSEKRAGSRHRPILSVLATSTDSILTIKMLTIRILMTMVFLRNWRAVARPAVDDNFANSQKS